jgi:hypothetical protein
MWNVEVVSFFLRGRVAQGRVELPAVRQLPAEDARGDHLRRLLRPARLRLAGEDERRLREPAGLVVQTDFGPERQGRFADEGQGLFESAGLQPGGPQTVVRPRGARHGAALPADLVVPAESQLDPAGEAVPDQEFGETVGLLRAPVVDEGVGALDPDAADADQLRGRGEGVAVGLDPVLERVLLPLLGLGFRPNSFQERGADGVLGDHPEVKHDQGAHDEPEGTGHAASLPGMNP